MSHHKNKSPPASSEPASPFDGSYHRSRSLVQLQRLGVLSPTSKLISPPLVKQETQQKRKSTCLVHDLLNPEVYERKTGDGPNEYPEASSAPELSDDSTTSLSSKSNFELLTKDAISDVAVSVRDLSSNLSNVTLKLHIRNVLVVTKINDESLIETTRGLALFLLNVKSKHGPLNVFIQERLKHHPGFGYEKLVKTANASGRLEGLKFWTEEMCGNHPNLFDFVITLGGDGTVLFTSWLFQKIVPPVLSFSMGSLGFMTEYDYHYRDQICHNALEKGVSCSLRMRFECIVMKAHSKSGKNESTLADEIADAGRTGSFAASHNAFESFCILNDVVVDRGPNPTITTTELYGDFKLLTAIQADGVVIATPSGSTAYSLSAGGPLVHPDLPAIIVSPICPHTLSFRPLVLPDSFIIRVGVPYDARFSAWCAFDGKNRVELTQGDFLTISASRYPFPKVTNGSAHTSWFERLSQTLHWNERKRQKPFSSDF